MIPGKLEDRVQYIDVRDVAEWMIRLAEEKASGIYNAVGPKEAHTMTDFIMEAKEAFDVESSFVQIDDYEFLMEKKIHNAIPWIMPEGNNYGSARINNQKALMSGLTFRNIQLTVKDIYNWWYSDALTNARRDEFESNPESLFSREKHILEDWKNRQKDLK